MTKPELCEHDSNCKWENSNCTSKKVDEAKRAEKTGKVNVKKTD